MFWANIGLVGGCTKFPGFRSRLWVLLSTLSFSIDTWSLSFGKDVGLAIFGAYWLWSGDLWMWWVRRLMQLLFFDADLWSTDPSQKRTGQRLHLQALLVLLITSSRGRSMQNVEVMFPEENSTIGSRARPRRRSRKNLQNWKGSKGKTIALRHISKPLGHGPNWTWLRQLPRESDDSHFRGPSVLYICLALKISTCFKYILIADQPVFWRFGHPLALRAQTDPNLTSFTLVVTQQSVYWSWCYYRLQGLVLVLVLVCIAQDIRYSVSLRRLCHHLLVTICPSKKLFFF